MDTLSNTLSTIMNNELRNKRECIVSPASKLVGNVLRVLQQNGYVGKFEFIDDGRFGKFEVQLLGRVNKCGAIRPRYSIQLSNFEPWEKKYLPSRELGILILSTSEGVLSHKDALQKNVGGMLLAYIY
ncbi:MAG: small subunit ribosomal protein [Thermoproteota archaeon]|nr:small subunit ribosomal protein [Thermoproteota archaeon]